MKILFVSHVFPRWVGDPAGAFIWRFARAAQARGHHVAAVAPHTRGARAGEEILDGVAVTRFRYARDAWERIGYQGAIEKSIGTPAALAILPWYFICFHRAVRRAVGTFKPDVVSVHWWTPGGIVAAGVTVPVAVTCHGSDVRLLGMSGLIRLVGRRVLGGVTGVSAVSQVMAGDLARWAGRRDVALTPMPVDDLRFTAGEVRAEPPVILFAGNLIRAKGVDLILRAAAELRRAGTRFTLRLVGDGPHRAEFERLAAELGITDVVEWAGAKGHDQMPAEYAAASVFVLASRGPRGEGMPLTVVEALLSGCAVVATPAGGVPELIVHGETGLLARDDDAGHLAEQLGRAVRDGALRARLAAAGRRKALARHGQVAAMDRFFDFLAEVAGRGPR